MSDADALYRPTEEHEAFRAAVREVCDAKVAPQAAETDELAEFPKASYEALVAADFHAPHIPEAYDGVGADALATVIVIEEVARACASSSLIPAVNKLASLPWLLAGSDELRQTFLPPIARGEAMASYCLSEPRRRSWASRARRPARSTWTAYAFPSPGGSVPRAPGSPPPCAPWTTPGSPSPPRRSASRRERWTSRWVM